MWKWSGLSPYAITDFFQGRDLSLLRGVRRRVKYIRRKEKKGGVELSIEALRESTVQKGDERNVLFSLLGN